MLRKILDEIQYVMDQVVPYLDEVEQEDLVVERLNNIIHNDKYNNKVCVKHLDKWYTVKVEKFLISYKVEIRPINEEPIIFNVQRNTIYTFYNGIQDVLDIKCILDKVINVLRTLPLIKAQQEQDKLTAMEKKDIKLQKAKLLSSFIEQTYEMD